MTTPSDNLLLPGQQVQTVTGRPDDGIPTSVLLIIVLFVIILVLAITCGVLRLCKKEEHIEGVPSYSVAISNRLFKERKKESKKAVDSLERRRQRGIFSFK